MLPVFICEIELFRQGTDSNICATLACFTNLNVACVTSPEHAEMGALLPGQPSVQHADGICACQLRMGAAAAAAAAAAATAAVADAFPDEAL